MIEIIRYRRASIEDISQIEEMEELYFPTEAFGRRQIRYLLQSPNAVTLVACSDSKVLGYVIGVGRRGSPTVRIYTFCVREDYRQKGIGTSLLQRLEWECQKMGLHHLILEVGDYNLPAIKFYTKNGFVEFSRIPEYYRNGTTAIRMKKTITQPLGANDSELTETTERYKKPR
ncbi:MAG TPA: GNAT family N-acetyltransferase [Candidatus Hypogeohydataceae bacterium YC41]